LTVELALLCSQIILTVCLFWLAARVRRLSVLASRATKREQAPAKWESSLRDLAAEVASLSSSYEKVAKLVTRLNSRAGMRELRSERDASEAAPPPLGASKAELRRHYGLNTSGPDFARRQMSLVPKE